MCSRSDVSARYSMPARNFAVLLTVLTCVLNLQSIVFIHAEEPVARQLDLQLRYQIETAEGTGRFHQLTHRESWNPASTAIIVCDVWDSHHCLNAVRRLEEMVPRMNQFLHALRDRGVTVIHAPSDCMEFYADHPARQQALKIPRAAQFPEEIGSWCYRIPSEERGVYPIDQSDGGEDDDPEEHARWQAELAARGLNPRLPWTRQHAGIDILDTDFITCEGELVWSILEEHQISQVMLVGVHTNMCVLGRPFGLRQMARHGKHVVLVRDLTDTMYNPQRWPYVSHFTGTDLIIDHIERWICPTISSDQLIGGDPFRFQGDTRARLAIIVSEDEYETELTLPDFAARWLGHDFQTRFIFGSETQRNDLPGLDSLHEADVLLLSVRRRTLPPDQLQLVREFVLSGKPVIGIRTANHAFCLRGQPPEDGFAEWREFDAEVFGGNYTNHYANHLSTTVVPATDEPHPLLRGVDGLPFVSTGSLYVVSPVHPAADVLLIGSVDGHDPEPVAWTWTRADDGRSFYTSLGHRDDFASDAFPRLLYHACLWAAGREIPEEFSPSPIDVPFPQE